MRRIRKGKFVSFDKLLPSSPDLPPVPTTKREPSAPKQTRTRRVTDLTTWLEAWNVFLLVRIHSAPHSALELAKYQALICRLFSGYPAAPCLRYDELFRQAAARNPLLPWDELKEDLLVWCVTRQQPFRPKLPALARLGPPPASAGGPPTTSAGGMRANPRLTHTPSGAEICRKFNSGRCTLGEACIFSHLCWTPGCGASHPGRSCTHKPSAPV